MLKKNYRILTAVLVVMLSIFLMLTGCAPAGTGDKPKDSTQQGSTQQDTPKDTTPDSSQDGLMSWQKDTSPFEFDIFFFAAWGTHYPWRGAVVEKYITEDTGVTMNIIIPTGNEKEYLNVMIASNDLPDAMVLEWYAPETKRLIDAGHIHAINDLAAEYAPELMDMISPDVINYHKHTDGKLYYLPSFMPTKEEYEESLEKHGARSLFIQKRIFEGLGKP
jgi:putative aldouronate transport system substrate-binding protein